MLLELQNVTREFAPLEGGQGVKVLAGVDLQVESGETVAIIGPSGSGKSSLLNIIGTLDVPSAGQVLLEGRDLSGLRDQELAVLRNRTIGFIFQAHHLLPHLTMLENVLIPTLACKSNPAEARGRAMKLLDRVGLSERWSHRPGQLSGGECQRVAVVRALINQPKLLLADEPTGALDHTSAEALAQLLLDLNGEEKVALVVVTHWREFAKRMGRVYELQNGKLHKI